MTGTDGSGDAARWWARGLLFECCSCQVVCPGHVHFEQLCTYDPCAGYWAIRFDDGEIELSARAKPLGWLTSPRAMASRP